VKAWLPSLYPLHKTLLAGVLILAGGLSARASISFIPSASPNLVAESTQLPISASSTLATDISDLTEAKIIYPDDTGGNVSSWMHLNSSTYDSDSGLFTFALSADQNNALVTRHCQLEVTISGETKQLDIFQSGSKKQLTITPTEVDVTKDDQNAKVVMKATVPWNAVSSNDTLITAPHYQGTNYSANLTIHIPANTDADPRAFQIVFSPVDSTTGVEPQTLLIYQDGTNPPAVPNITVQPVDDTEEVGNTATFSVTADGIPAPTYLWQSQEKGSSDWSNVTNTPAPSTFPHFSGASNATLTIDGITKGLNGNSYRCILTNHAGSVVTDEVILTVTYAPQVLAQPQDNAVVAGNTANFTAVVDGTPTPDFQWQASSDGGSNWGDLSDNTIYNGTKTSVLTVKANLTLTGYKFRLEADTGIDPSTTTDAATLTVSPPPVAPQIKTAPVAVRRGTGQSVTLSVTATGTGPFGYQWQLNGIPIIDNAHYSGTTAANLRISNINGEVVGSYSVVILNEAGQVITKPVKLTLGHPPTITQQPNSATAKAGSTVHFSVVTGGDTPQTFQWQKGGKKLSASATVAGPTAKTLTLRKVKTSDGGAYRVVVTNDSGSVTSANARLTVK